MQMLKLEQDSVEDHQPLDASVDPCWIDSAEESKIHFDSFAKKLNDWYRFMTRKVTAIRRSTDVSFQIRRSGNFDYSIF